MSDSPTPGSGLIHDDAFLNEMMKRQLRLSISCAAAFTFLLVALPMANYLAPQFMAQRVAGFTLSWLVLGVLFFPYVWIISRIFIGRSIALEKREVESVKQQENRI